AGLINALKIVDKKIEDTKIIINGAGAAGTAIANLLTAAGAKNIIACDKSGALYAGMPNMNEAKSGLADATNPNKEKGSLADVMNNADVFIGVSAADVVKAEMVKTMAKDAVILAMANPTPEIMPDIAIAAGARVVGTGRSDFPNQINNVLVFPGVFRGALNVRAKEINLEMKIAAAHSIANYIKADELNENNIIPSALDKGVASAVAQAIEEAARKSGAARL
ncbi:NAD-dependent malic enzyme, partial [Sedimentibacter sp.]|uniref:NAD(P)-dependent malic enzyme n=1 Tax=Sedimentibacter sp. TaxID=1960295 RepID=UPI00289FE029